MSKAPLHQQIKEQIGSKTVARIEIPSYISDNLKYSLFDWQKDAIRHFLAFNESEYEFDKPEEAPFHLLFNMATGTGKTLLMAGLILHYYKKWYRNFIFFVNQNNIVDKTENNFIDKNHTKYLFNQNIIIDEKNVKIKKVETFSNDSDNIEIKFTSIHKLHNDIYTVRENAVYLEDLQKRDIIMLGDEAHHLNADTKKKKTNQIEASLEYTEVLSQSPKQEDIEKSWENTVINKILHKDHKNQSENRNVLLEFTATIPDDDEVQKKYQNKIIFLFDLKEFLKAGYTKEINLISSSFERKERILQALLLNWYRHKIATENNIANFKGVILFRSKDIASSKEDFEAFHDIIENLTISDFDFLKRIGAELTEWTASYDKWISRIKEMVKVIQGEWILGEAIQYIQYSFKKENCIITNSEDNKTQKEKTNEWQEKLLNSLENHNNHIRAIFTVQRLTEWWDVLNLFDIVRLYEKQNTGWSSTKWKTPTTSEVQLIGRGVRYYPFDYSDKIKNKRKFDDDLEHPLRILEELFYHSDNDSKYISDLKNELKKEWYIQDNKEVKTFKLKQEFKETDFYKNLYIALNNQIDNPNRRKITLEEIKRNFAFDYEMPMYSITEEEILLEEKNDNTKYQKQEWTKTTVSVALKDFDYHIFRKAIAKKSKNDTSIFQFERLKEELKIESVDDLLKDDFLGSFAMNIVIENWKTFSDITPDKQLHILSNFLDKISVELKQYSNPYNGDEFKLVKFADNFFDKEKMIDTSISASSLEQDLLTTKWYVLNGFNGSSEEEHLIRAVMKTIWNLQDTYDEVYLLRNEEVLKIYDFKTGTGFQPDFLLFLKEKWKNKYYQIFIEPKGTHLLEKDEWKNVFLKEITSRYGEENTLQFANDDYVIVGLPLYNKDHSKEFDDEYVKLY